MNTPGLPSCLLITGAIGSGKTFISARILRNLDLPYVSPDIYFQYLISCSCCTNDNRYNVAKGLCRKRLQWLFEDGQSFVWETVVVSDWKWEFLSECARRYFLTVLYVSVGSLDVCLRRSSMRAANGWYEVPGSKVIDSFDRIELAKDRLRTLADVFVLIDNSNDIV